MKIKRRKIILVSISIIILMIICFLTRIIDIRAIINNTNMHSAMYGDPIDLDTGIINNEYFNINSNGENAKDTTKGLCEAIEYASNNNINNIKLEEGKYLINGEGDRNTRKGIVLASNINLDLNNSTIIHETNGSIRYSIFALYNIENVSISNGIIIGDRYTHDYETIDSTHEWGFGVEIQGSNNINIYNLDISEMAGDGIVVSGYTGNGNEKASSNVSINNNTISKCRRQGISVTNANNVKIYDNEIYKISGAYPGALIDLEPDNLTQLVKNVEIYNNKLQNGNRLNSVQIMVYVENIDIHDNEINGNFVMYGSKDKVKISNNIINNASLLFTIPENRANNPNLMNKIEMTKNTITSSTFMITNVNDILIDGNHIARTDTHITSSNVAISNNIYTSLQENKFIHKCTTKDGDGKTYNLYLYNNTLPENAIDVILESDLINIYSDYESINEYVMNKFME